MASFVFQKDNQRIIIVRKTFMEAKSYLKRVYGWTDFKYLGTIKKLHKNTRV